jgi:acyl carrier protein
MGLDSVEIIMKVEKTFGINIPDREAEKIITVGDFHNSVWQHLEGKHSEKCKSQNLFYKLRQSLVDTFGFSKKKFRLDTSLNKIFPQDNRREAYFSFANANNLELPKLVLTKSWSTFLNSFGIATILGGLGLSFILIFFFDYSKWTLLIPVAGIVLTYFVSGILNPMRTVIQPEYAREFTQEVLSLNCAELTKESGVSRQEVESIINNILADLAGLELDEVTPEKKIHDDLGID